MVAADARVDEARLLVAADDEDRVQLQRTAHVLNCGPRGGGNEG